MESPVELTITIKVDTSQAELDVAQFRSYALQALDEIKSAYAALGASSYADGDWPEASDEPLTGEQVLKRRV